MWDPVQTISRKGRVGLPFITTADGKEPGSRVNEMDQDGIIIVMRFGLMGYGQRIGVFQKVN